MSFGCKRNLKALYKITADLKSGVLSIQVYDAATKRKWRSEFTQKNFIKRPIFDVASTLIDSINSMNNENAKKICNFIPIQISEYNKWCYVGINGTELTFALRPININNKESQYINNQQSMNKKNKNNKNKTTLYRQQSF